MTKELIHSLQTRKELPDIGSKAANIRRLAQLGMRVPITYVLSWEAYQRYQENDVSVIDQIGTELDAKLNPDRCYAVRSSANIEDCFEHSFAGQFKSVLNVRGRNEFLKAIWSIWATAQTPQVQTYLATKQAGCQDGLRMAIILQEMVNPVVSGVAFSRNPMTGAREIVVEAVSGPGTMLMQEGVTPQRWTFRGGQVSAQPAAQPVVQPGEPPGEKPIPDALAGEVVEGVRQIARKTRQDVDLEWVYDGSRLFWVQMREITSLKQVNIYSSSMAREMVPGALKPLVWSINTPLMLEDKIRLLNELTGVKGLKPEDLVHAFYYHTYFNNTKLTEVLQQVGFAAESIEMLLGVQTNSPAPDGEKKASKHTGMPPFRPRLSIVRHLPRMLAFFWNKWSIPPLLDRILPEMETALQGYPVDAADQLAQAEILACIDRLHALNQEIAYYNVIIQLSCYVYSGMLRNHLKKCGVDFAGVDMNLDTSEFHRFNPNFHLERLHQQFLALDPALQEQIRHSTFREVIENSGLGEFSAGLARLLRDFGHLSEKGNDFSTPVWRENADMILRLAIDYTPRSSTEASKKIGYDQLQLSGYRRWLLKVLYNRARNFLLYREHISHLYTMGFGLLRAHFLALGRKLAGHGQICAPDDIFYLEDCEVRRLATQTVGAEPPWALALVEQRKRSIEQVRGMSLPTVIYGEEPPPVQIYSKKRLTGTPTSRGYCTAPVRVVTGLQDFPRVQPGDILVIPFSEVAWTPLFARAAGVIAEAGGMLSHSSIVAREYGIPAIVSVAGATQLADGTLVSMDGYKGEVLIFEDREV